MILYVNGDSHSAGAEAVHYACFANDDSKYTHLGRKPHPENLEVSYGKLLANRLGAELHCDAESASSNTRIIRTTREYLSKQRPDLIIIGWSTWEREEWEYMGNRYQVSGSGTDRLPGAIHDKYKQWVINTANTATENELHWHFEIYKFHQELQSQNIPHLFFNTYRYFAYIANHNLEKYNWDGCYVDPYNQNSTYYFWLKEQGLDTVSEQSYHFGKEAHIKWAEHLLPMLTVK